MRHNYYIFSSHLRSIPRAGPINFRGRGPEVRVDESVIDPSLPFSVYQSQPPHTRARITAFPKLSVSLPTTYHTLARVGVYLQGYDCTK